MNTFDQLEESAKKKQTDTTDFKKKVSTMYKKVRPVPKPAANTK